ncbi:hypothetical protein [Bradyrhizobium sp.]|uniref:hypothetical protein n=1 Tax=Bradyrhizobium sp. TaxID=376 RepID=UPI0023A55AA8|nr:hypothetical protein [Bradyrhizobium sp.]MDE1933807.1 hypothetical protein [Bradyrhizobium sp.]
MKRLGISGGKARKPGGNNGGIIAGWKEAAEAGSGVFPLDEMKDVSWLLETRRRIRVISSRCHKRENRGRERAESSEKDPLGENRPR